MEGMAFKAISPEEAQARITEGALEIIDVREYHEWVDGHLAGARLIPLADFRANPKAQLPPVGIAVLFVCAAGVRSETAARLAASSGFASVYNLKGGTRAWAKAGLSLEVEAAASAAE
jgi:rhodanese-related sulfurtransferase